MHPSRPSSPDPNAPYRAAIAALGGNFTNEQEIDQPQPEPHHFQQNAHEGLVPRRKLNHDRLNQIAHHLGSGVQVALELMAPEQVQHENVAEPSNTTPPANVPQASHANIDTLRWYFDQMGIRHSTDLNDSTIKNRLDSVNLSVEALIAAMDIAHTPNHPTLIASQANENERLIIIASLAKCMKRKDGFDPPVRNAALNANNNPHELIYGILLQLRNRRN